MDNKKIGIVTVLYNSEPVLEDFFRTLNEQTYKNFILYLVDNASKDASVQKGYEYAKLVDFECKWLCQKENLGVAEGNNIGIELTGNGFLYNMVRIISGTLVDVGLGKIKPEEIENIINSKDRQKAGKTLAPQGLFLVKVEYET